MVSTRQLVLVAIVAAIVSAAMAVIVTTAINPPNAGAQSATAAVNQKAVVKQLVKLQKLVGTGKFSGLRGEVHTDFHDLGNALHESCRAVTDGLYAQETSTGLSKNYECPAIGSVAR